MQRQMLLIATVLFVCSLTTGQYLEWCDYFRRQGQTNRPECTVQGTITASSCQSRINEAYMDCGTPCPATCTNQNPDCANIAHNCVVNCYCNPGFVRDMEKPNQPCVQPQQCSTTQSCPAGEVFQACGTACQPTCSLRNPVCTNVCTAGCFCQTGFIRRNNNDICVPLTQCSNNQCPMNEVYQSCGSACPSTCQNRNPTCVQVCVSGCFCSPGFLRDLSNGRNSCVAPLKCTTGPNGIVGAVTCAATERYLSCGSPCPATCNNRNPTCQNYCAAGCFCLPGYVRNTENVCILPQFCPTTATKAGTCPPPSYGPGQSMTLTIECSGDSDCSGTMKCCMETSGSRLCRYPSGTPEYCGNVQCPASYACINQQCTQLSPNTGCSYGWLCPTGFDCINNVCTYNWNNNNGAGNGSTSIHLANRFCPTNPPKDCKSEPIIISCNNDSNCANNMKCCQANFCGGRICKQGIVVTTGN